VKKYKAKPFKFKKGEGVVVEDPGHNYPNADEWAKKMRATAWKAGWSTDFRGYCRGSRATILGRARNSLNITIYLIEINKIQHVIGESGLVNLLKGILKYEK